MAREIQAILTNMCMVCDEEYVLAEDKVKGSYTGVVFPGGHVEEGEALEEAVIREVYEESGLMIRNPSFCGIYHWITETGARHLLFIYRASEFSGELRGSSEGKVRWVRKEEFLQEALAHDMDKVFAIAMGERKSEYFYRK